MGVTPKTGMNVLARQLRRADGKTAKAALPDNLCFMMANASPREGMFG